MQIQFSAARTRPMRSDIWKLEQVGALFHNGNGTIRKLVAIIEGNDMRMRSRRVSWEKVSGKGKPKGTGTWASWTQWVYDEWLEPCPEQLPVPEVLDVELAFPTGKHTPPWRWVPVEFHDGRNLWSQVIAEVFSGHRKWEDWSALPKEGVDGEQAFRAVRETVGNWNIKHERKVATAGWMLSQWFEDFWWKGDTRTTIYNADIPKEMQS